MSRVEWTWCIITTVVGCFLVNMLWAQDANAAEPGMTLSHHRVVIASTMDPCLYEEGDESVPPCYWDAEVQGNGEGSSFYWDGVNIRYVWATDPTVGPKWRWVPGSVRAMLRDEGLSLSVSCMWRTDGDDYSIVRCASGSKYMVGF